MRAVLYFLLASLMAPAAAAAVCIVRCTLVEHQQARGTSPAACHDSAGNEAAGLAVSGGEACHDEAGRVDARLADRLAVPAPALAPLARHLSDATARLDAGTRTPRPPRIILITQLRI